MLDFDRLEARPLQGSRLNKLAKRAPAFNRAEQPCLMVHDLKLGKIESTIRIRRRNNPHVDAHRTLLENVTLR